jgi:23S rRNA (cytidine1920-2'-O)/16S rRNA (cytidine1409-2'-O)-methyltransferase
MTREPPNSGDADSRPGAPRRPARQRLDLLLVERGLAESREQARRLILAGEVTVNDVPADKPGHTVPIDAALRVRAPLPYVSRGGLKLAHALDAFGLDVTGLIAVDVGASTGGFTDCLLQRGAARIFAVDVGYGQLAWKVRNDPRVTPLERTNIRHLEQLPGGALAQLAVIDASFIGLALVLPPTLRLLTPESEIVALIKPQFEAGRADVGKRGVVRERAVHERVLREVTALAAELHLAVAGLTASPLLGPAGNVEFLIWLRRAPGAAPLPNLEGAVRAALEEAEKLTR